jgi:formylglycine-generating enzyme required for sulfatase activity
MRRLPFVILPAAGLAVIGIGYLASAGPSASVQATIEPGSQQEAPVPSPAARPTTVAVPVGSGTTWVDADEVTVEAFGACVAAGACSMDHVTVIPDSTCNYEVKGRETHPMNCVSWQGAEQYCRFAGARLCKAEEWFSACRGPADQDFPYGAAHDSAACNVTAQVGPIGQVTTMPVGSAPGCEGGYPGLHDMVGNVSEWLDSCTGDYCKFYGGAFITNEPLEDFASCKQICAGNKKDFRSSTLGIRCCRDAPPAGR